MPQIAPISPEQMMLVLEVSRALAVTSDLDKLLLRIAEAATTLLQCERASIFLHDDVNNQLWTKIALGSTEIRIPCDKGIVGAAFQGNTLLHIPNPYEDPRFNPEPDRKSGFHTRSLLTAPMVNVDRKPVGVIQAVNKCGESFSESDHVMIQLLADQAGVAIQRYRLQVAAIESVALRREMDLAKTVQEAMIPKFPPTVPGLEAVGWTKPASITGGDCYDLWQLPDGRLAIFVGDASGHGIAPALVVSQVRTLVRALSDMQSDPKELFTRINARLSEDVDAGRFVTAFLGFMGPAGDLTWCSAGHGPILYRTAPGEPLQTLDPGAPPLGVLSDFLADEVPSIQLQPGGTLLVMTDGIFESFNTTGQQFGVERVIESLDLHANGKAESAVTALRQTLLDWQGAEEPHDDQTIVAIRRTG
jgi:phosphoserine phosphatase RsbU/P